MTGALLVERGLVTPAQLAEALEHQRANGGDLEDVLQYLHGVTPEQIATVVGEYRRREISVDVGSLLIAAGAVAEGALEEARRRSADSGQPLGPILVEMGAITRLELASALAEQWSDTPAQILPPPGAAEREPGASAEDVQDLRFAMRALEASVRAEREHEVGEDALEEIQRREDVLAARVAALEIAIEQPIEVDPVLAEELHATAERLSAVQTSLGELARAEDVAALAAALRELDEVRATVAMLGERQAQLAPAEALQIALDDLARLSERVDGVVAAVDEVVERTDLAALREAVDALAARPAGDPELAQRVDELVCELGSLSVLAEASSGADGLQEAIAELAQRVDAAADVAAAAGVELDELRPLVDRVESARVDAERAARELDDLRRVVEELAQL
ncbi:MAG: hypothetical protein ACRC50_06095, partial [Gaiella sp.]